MLILLLLPVIFSVGLLCWETWEDERIFRVTTTLLLCICLFLLMLKL